MVLGIKCKSYEERLMKVLALVSFSKHNVQALALIKDGDALKNVLLHSGSFVTRDGCAHAAQFMHSV